MLARRHLDMLPRVHPFDTAALLVDALCARIARLAAQCCDERGYFTIVLAGGSTPRELYQQLRHLVADWQRWHIYFGDERCLPAGHPDRNDSMAAVAWLDHVAIPPPHIHRVPISDNASAAALAYACVLAQAPGFDLALLGLGEDGHTASLFPGDELAYSGAELAIAITAAPKPPPQRVSMSPRCLSMASAVWFVVSGESKRCALEAWLNGAQLPPRLIQPRAGVDIFTDLSIATRNAQTRDS